MYKLNYQRLLRCQKGDTVFVLAPRINVIWRIDSSVRWHRFLCTSLLPSSFSTTDNSLQFYWQGPVIFSFPLPYCLLAPSPSPSDLVLSRCVSFSCEVYDLRKISWLKGLLDSWEEYYWVSFTQKNCNRIYCRTEKNSLHWCVGK